MDTKIVIKKCGHCSVLGSLYASELCDVMQNDGLKGLRKFAEQNKITICCFGEDETEVKKQLSELGLTKAVTVSILKNHYTRAEVEKILSDYRVFGPTNKNIMDHENWVFNNI